APVSVPRRSQESAPIRATSRVPRKNPKQRTQKDNAARVLTLEPAPNRRQLRQSAPLQIIFFLHNTGQLLDHTTFATGKASSMHPTTVAVAVASGIPAAAATAAVDERVAQVVEIDVDGRAYMVALRSQGGVSIAVDAQTDAAVVAVGKARHGKGVVDGKVVIVPPVVCDGAAVASTSGVVLVFMRSAAIAGCKIRVVVVAVVSIVGVVTSRTIAVAHTADWMTVTSRTIDATHSTDRIIMASIATSKRVTVGRITAAQRNGASKLWELNLGQRNSTSSEVIARDHWSGTHLHLQHTSTIPVVRPTVVGRRAGNIVGAGTKVGAKAKVRGTAKSGAVDIAGH
ncbi:hypothetical protein B0T20DRAFT_491284, partial [Sordaria brevicollis]